MQPMSAELKAKLKERLILDEEDRKFPYHDTKGNITIGVGYNLTARGLPENYRMELLEYDMAFHWMKLCQCFVWFQSLADHRKIVLLSMSFNLGFQRFLTFNKMLSAIARRDYEEAAKEMLDSKWAHEVGERAVRLSKMMEDDTWNG